MGKFQLATIIIFIVLAVTGLLMFAGVIPTPDRNPGTRPGWSASLTMWGTADTNVVKTILAYTSGVTNSELSINYIKKDPEKFEVELLRSIVDQTGPDLILFSDDLLLTIEGSLWSIPYDWLDARTYREYFIEGAEVLLKPDGMPAMPVAIDPLVLYWNRDIFNDERIIEVPDSWSEVMDFSKKVTQRDARGKILRSAIALGESNNVNNYKEIVSLLIMQTGSDLAVRLPNGLMQSSLYDSHGANAGTYSWHGAASALSYYVGFADPVLSNYSWNSSLINSIDTFIAGDLAMYIGYASDKAMIDRLNPHLNYDIAPVPQLLDGPRDVTFGRVISLGVLKTSSQWEAALSAIFKIAVTDTDIQKVIAQSLYLPPAKRQLLLENMTDPFLDTFYKEAIIARTWLDPNPVETDKIFGTMIKDTLSKKLDAISAITNLDYKLQDLFSEQ